MPVYFEKQAYVGALLFNKVLTKVLAKYSNYNNVFLTEYATKLSENTRINKHPIKPEKSK